MLKELTTAPAFELIGDDSKLHSLNEFKGKWLMLYFYPKDNTPGCTLEACGLRDNWDEFVEQDMNVIGISADSVESHQKFKEKYKLPFLLLSDQEKESLKAYEAWGEKSMFGKKYFDIKRISYIIDPSGKIAKAYEKVSPTNHANTLLKDLKELQKIRS